MKLRQKYKEILSTFQKDKRAELFLQPVPWKQLGLTDYPTIVKNPMDLGTIESKIDKYQDPQQFIDDLNLVWNNCKSYNQEGSDIYRIAQYFLKETIKYAKYFKEEKKKKLLKQQDKQRKKQFQQLVNNSQKNQSSNPLNQNSNLQYQIQEQGKDKEIKYDQKIQLGFNLRNSDESNLVEFIKLVLDNCDYAAKTQKEAININLSHLDQNTANKALQLFNQDQQNIEQKEEDQQSEI